MDEFDGLVNENPESSLAAFMDSFDVSVDLPENAVNFVTGLLNYSPETILTQITHAIKMSHVDSDKPVVLWEHDVMYPDGYIGKVCAPIVEGCDYSLYYDHVFADCDGFYKPSMHFWHLSRYAARISSLYGHFYAKIGLGSTGILEPVPAEFANGDERPGDIVHNYGVVHGAPVLDIKHGANASGQILVDGRSVYNAVWGDFSRIGCLLADPEYDKFLKSRPDIGYGLFTCKSSDDW